MSVHRRTEFEGVVGTRDFRGSFDFSFKDTLNRGELAIDKLDEEVISNLRE